MMQDRFKARSAAQWRTVIVKNMKTAGTYNECFEIAVSTLSQILEKRDAAEAELIESGEGMTVEHINQGGAVYVEQNPKVRLINDLNRDALSYMRECGITPKGLKQIKDKAMDVKTEDPLDVVLRKLGR